MDLTNNGEMRRVENEWYAPSMNVQRMNAQIDDVIDCLSLSSLQHMDFVVLYNVFHFHLATG